MCAGATATNNTHPTHTTMPARALFTRAVLKTLNLFESIARIVPDSGSRLPDHQQTFSEWTQVIPNARLCKALLDRITDQDNQPKFRIKPYGL